MQPITYLFDFELCNDEMRPYIMNEFAKNGAKHLVLSDEFIMRMERTPGFANTLRTEMANAGLSFVDSHAPFGWWEDMDVPVESARPIMLERLRLAMRIVAQFEVDTITIHVGNAPACFGDEYSLDYYHSCILRSIEALLPLAEELKMVICVENIWTPLNTAEKLLDMIDHFKSPYLGICYDAGHANLMIDHGYDDCNAVNAFARYGMKPPYDDKIIDKLHPHIVNCHIHDNDGQIDQHRLPGKGNVDWNHVIPLLKSAPRIRSFQSEVIPVRTGASICELVSTIEKLFA